MPPRMITGVNSPQKASLRARSTSEADPLGAPLYPWTLLTSQTETHRKAATTIPGRTPAANRVPTDCCMMSP
ncbi:MAG: hypothetical protein BWY99_01710 [Synergistetes bacterium ADurb.BinA166]|nr:MAG: hypothetical protein BWY99_01710 [Synergistetes bacterium ADurb.BinA166]